MSTAAAAATATPLQAIRETQSDVNSIIPRRENLMGNRYAWFGLDDVWHDDINAMTNGRNGGHMRRCKWQPITRAPRWVHVGALGEAGAAEIVARRNPDKMTGKMREEMYWIKPASIQASLNMLYAERGMVDSGVLRYVELDTFEALQLDDLFFPEDDANLPRTFRECEARVMGQIEKLKAGAATAPDGRTLPIPPATIPSIIKIGEEMLHSLRTSARYGRICIDERHAEMEKAATDTTGKYRGTYDNRERRLLEWLEITPRNQALEKIALDSNQLPAVITQMANVVAAQAMQQPQQQIDVAALGKAIGGALAQELAPLLKGQEQREGTAVVPPAPAPAPEDKSSTPKIQPKAK